VVLALHAGYFAAEKTDLSRRILWDYVAGKNIASVLLLVIIVAATATSTRKRVRRTGRRTSPRLAVATPAE